MRFDFVLRIYCKLFLSDSKFTYGLSFKTNKHVHLNKLFFMLGMYSQIKV